MYSSSPGKLTVCLLVLGLFVSFPPQANAQRFMTKNGTVEFHSKASLNEFVGSSNHLHGLVDLNDNSLDFYVDLNTLTTGIKLRDRHMRENYLETKKYPFAEFTGKLSPQDLHGLKLGQAVQAVGDFKIHGRKKAIKVPGKLQLSDDGKELMLKAEFVLKLSDYGIEVPGVLFYELSEVQEVKIKAILKNENN